MQFLTVKKTLPLSRRRKPMMVVNQSHIFKPSCTVTSHIILHITWLVTVSLNWHLATFHVTLQHRTFL